MFEPSDFLLLCKLGSETSTAQMFLDELRVAWEELSFAYQRLDPNQCLLPASTVPGYLTTTCGKWHVFVPWPLVTSFPGPEIISTLLDAGSTVAIQPMVNLCISGSSAALGQDIVIADLDFCQYVELPPRELVHGARVFTSATDARILTKASYGNQSDIVAIPPWEQSWLQLEATMTNIVAVDDAQRFMLDFIGYSARFGLMPISNVILPTSRTDRTLGAADQSFVFQEAVATPMEQQAPPWGLVDPIQLCKYLRYLRAKMISLLDDSPVKALKRALSLSYTIRLHSFAPRALDILRSTECRVYLEARKATELRTRSNKCCDQEREFIMKYAPGCDAAKEVPIPEFEKLTKKCRDLVNGLLAEIKALEEEIE